MSSIRVRFAPSPTGPLHIGGVRTALYNYLFAKKHKGKIILRVEDTDQSRFVKGAEDYIIKSLNWCGINFDESIVSGGNFGPYRQSDRKSLYLEYANQLVKNNFAYYAFDTSEELIEMRDNMKKAGVPSPQYNSITRKNMQNSLSLSEDEVNKRITKGDDYVIRIKMPRNEEVKINDLIRGWVSVNSNNMDDKVIFKSDGMPTYHLANVVDDYLMKISHVIRGEEWLPSAPLHVLLYRYLGWEDKMPEFAHLPLILKPDGNGKLSKRDGDRLGFPVFPIEWKNPETGDISSGYRESGYFPSAFINMLSFLGWNPGTTQEIFSMPELIDTFSLERVGKAGAKFDFDKTRWFNQQYLRAKSSEELSEKLQEILKEQGIVKDNKFVAQVCEQLKERATFVNDLWELSSFFFQSPKQYDEKSFAKIVNNNSRELMSELTQVLNNISDFTTENIQTEVKAWIGKKEVGFGKVMQPLRLALVGAMQGPDVFEIIFMIGKTQSVERIKNLIETV